LAHDAICATACIDLRICICTLHDLQRTQCIRSEIAVLSLTAATTPTHAGNLAQDSIQATMTHAHAAGVRLVDTAAASHNEHIIAAANANLDPPMAVLTKVWYTHLGYVHAASLALTITSTVTVRKSWCDAFMCHCNVDCNSAVHASQFLRACSAVLPQPFVALVFHRGFSS
jgi:diketogulonate reductase-like aldo/keto reductase